MSSFVYTRMPKLCFANPGDTIFFLSDEHGVAIGDPHLVVVQPVSGARSARKNASNGLYDDQRPLFLVNLANGEAVKMPHLSTRVEIVRNKVSLSPEEAKATALHQEEVLDADEMNLPFVSRLSQIEQVAILAKSTAKDEPMKKFLELIIELSKPAF